MHKKEVKPKYCIGEYVRIKRSRAEDSMLSRSEVWRYICNNVYIIINVDINDAEWKGPDRGIIKYTCRSEDGLIEQVIEEGWLEFVY